MIEEIIYQSGFLGLFVISFLAATLIPLSSEIFVVTMTLGGYNPLLLFFFATTGNTLGAIVNYYVGRYGADFVLSRYVKIDSEVRQSMERRYQKWGSPILFFAWAPIIGDPLTVVAGGFRMNIQVFLFWVILGKAFRYGFLIVTAGMW